MLLAEGALDVVGEFDLKPYDMAALVPIVEEAGGRFTSIDGEPGPWHGSALATNGVLHDELLDQFSLGEKPAEKVRNNHLSLLAMVDCWWKLGIVPYDHMICSTPVSGFEIPWV